MSPRVVEREVPVRPATVRRAPALINKASCIPHEGEVEINGGCWVALEKRPPCFNSQAEYKGKCYLPVSARSRNTREPRSLYW